MTNIRFKLKKRNNHRKPALINIKIQETPADYSELHRLLKEGLEDISTGNTRPFSDAISDIRKKRKQ